MYASDIKHTNKTLQNKLESLYSLNRGARMELSFRPQYIELLEKLGNPHRALPPTIHVAGTNGKGSTIAFLKAILEAAGKHVHTYTSPHLHRFNERIVLNGTPINDTDLETRIDEIITLNNGADISFFEITTALAFKAFADTPANILLLEVGLGGRLDCTNIIPTSTLSIINTVSMDHMDFLGNTLEDIATEKAGIIKPNTPCILGPQTCDPNLFHTVAKTRNAPLYTHGSDWTTDPTPEGFTLQFRNDTTRCPPPNLKGLHQIQNAGLAIAALKILNPICSVLHHHIVSGLQNTSWPGRLEDITKNYPNITPENWTILYDGGHNKAAGEALATELSQTILTPENTQNPKHVHLILGMMSHKKPQEFLTPLLPHIQSITCIPIPNEPNSLTLEELQNILHNEKPENKTTIPVHKATTAKNAIKQLQSTPITDNSPKTQNPNPKSPPPSIILITGSLYLADHL